MRRVVITGLGSVSPYGVGVQALRQGLREQGSAIGPVRLCEGHAYARRNGGQVDDQQLEGLFTASECLMLDRATRFALLAGSEALASAGFAVADAEQAQGCAVYVGTALGGSESTHLTGQDLYGGGSATLAPWAVPRAMANAPASHLSIRHGFTGPSLTLSTACASSTQAVGEAWRLLRSGDAELALAGGTDACLNPLAWKAWEALRAMAPDTCRPFSAGRRGMVLGEGAAMLVLETLEHARERGAPILAEVLGYGVSSDAGDLVKPSVDGPLRAMRGAMRQAAVAPDRYDYINAHGTGTVLNDRCETAAIKAAFGDHAPQLCVSAVKSAVGHLMGAAGALELVAGLLAIGEGWVPATFNHEGPDPECDLDYVTEGPRTRPVGYWLKNAFAFGGLNTCLALGPAPQASP